MVKPSKKKAPPKRGQLAVEQSNNGQVERGPMIKDLWVPRNGQARSALESLLPHQFLLFNKILNRFAQDADPERNP